MKKSISVIILIALLTGCSNTNVKKTFFFEEKEKVFDLYDETGDELTNNNYSSYKKVGTDGYVVQKGEEYGYLLSTGKESIALGKYQSLEVLGKMVIAKETKDDKETITIFNGKGKELYKTGKDVSITLSGLPIIKEDKRYTVLNLDGSLYTSGEEKITSASIFEEAYVLVNYNDSIIISSTTIKESSFTIDVKGMYSLMDHHVDKGYLLYDKEAKKTVLIDPKGKNKFSVEQEFDTVEFTSNGTIIGQKGQTQYLVFEDKKEPLVINSYCKNDKNYVIKNKDFIYGPHMFYKDGKEIEVKDVQLDPLASTISQSLFPVYIKNKGYGYYNFDGQQAIDAIYQKAGVFDVNNRAIVQKDDKYYLINNEGKKSSNEYVHIELIDNGYYAGYTTDNKYEVIDKEGTKVIDDVFMGTKSVISYGDIVYGIFNKNGKTYVYDMNHEYKMLFDLSGDVIFHKDGYLVANKKVYYSMNGKKLYER